MKMKDGGINVARRQTQPRQNDNVFDVIKTGCFNGDKHM